MEVYLGGTDKKKGKFFKSTLSPIFWMAPKPMVSHNQNTLKLMKHGLHTLFLSCPQR